MSDNFYRAELNILEAPEVLPAGIFERVTVKVQNTGNGVFSALRPQEGRGEVALAYHWYDNRRRIHTWDGMRTSLPHDLHPQQTTTLQTEIYTPSEPGKYLLEVSLVEEGVAWFEQKGNRAARVWITVVATAEQAHPAVKCSIVIPVFNRLAFTEKCLQSLPRSISGSKYEVIVVDNGSTDGTQAFLQFWIREDLNRQVVSFGTNAGFARACNAGARLARGKYLVLLNNDTVPAPRWLEAMVRVADDDSEVGIVGSKLLYPNGRIQHLGIVFDKNNNPRHIHRGASGSIHVAYRNREYQAVTGACLLIRRDIFESVNGLDEQFRNSFEDVDLCLRVRANGKRVVLCAESTVYHFEGMSEGRAQSDPRNSLLFKARWQGKIEADAERWYEVDGLPADLNCELRAPRGYSSRQEELLQETFKRLYGN